MCISLSPDRQPFVYIIRNIDTGIRYAGVKFSKGCKPSDLLTTYFTSSNIVKSLIASGSTFIIDKIITFDSKELALEFEEFLLQEVNAAYSDDWYNQAIGKAINPDTVRKTCLEKYGVDSWMKSEEAKKRKLGFKEGNTYGCFNRSDETKRRMSEAFTGRVFSEEHCKNISIAKTGIKLPEEVVKKMSESRTRGLHPRAIKLTTPIGDFDCINDAADAYNVSSSCIRKWLKTKPDEFKRIK